MSPETPAPAPRDPLGTVRERARTNLFWRHLGIEVDDAREGWVRLRVPVRDPLRNAAGAPVHGGVYSALVDTAVGGALSTLHDAAAGGVGQTTLDLNVSFLAAAARATSSRRAGSCAAGAPWPSARPASPTPAAASSRSAAPPT